MAGLTIDRVSKRFDAFTALDQVSLSVADGDFLAVLGPSGCGKTTLLRLIAGFEGVTAGEVRIGDTVVSSPTTMVPPERRKVGIVFQNYALWPHMTVAENVGYALRVARVPAADRVRRVRAALDLVELGGLADRMPANLSGGQRQRVALARCLVAEPALVLFDEPLANLDVHLRAAMEAEFAAFHKRTGTTVVYITHDQAEAMALADRIAVLDHGRLMQLGTPQALYHEPANPMVAGFIAQGMVLPVTVLAPEAQGRVPALIFGHPVTLRCQPGTTPRAGALACVRAEHVLPGPTGIAVTITRVTYRGGGARVVARPDEGPEHLIHFDQPDPVTCATGARIRVTLRDGWLIPDP